MIRSMSRLFVALLMTLPAGASAQTMGAVVKGFNILASPAVTLTGFAASPFNVSVVGTSPGVTLTLTNATVTTYHANNATAVNGQAEAAILNASLTAPAGATTIALAAATLPPALAVGGGITVYTAAADLQNTNTATTITGSPSSVVIFRVASFMTMTNHDVILAGGISPSNVYWQVQNNATVTNNDAATRSFPGTIIVAVTPDDVAVTCSGAGSLSIGRLISLGGDVTVTNSGAGALIIDFPAEPAAAPGAAGCTEGTFYPSPATGAVGTFGYCMAAAGSVKIRVYNTIGDLAVKVDDTKAAGTQTSTINTARLAPGVYLYLIERAYNNGNKSRSAVKKFVVKH